MTEKIMRITDNDNGGNVNTSNTDSNCPDSNAAAAIPNTAEGSIPQQPEIAGFFPLSGKSRPKFAPADKTTATPPDGKYAEVFADGIAVVEVNKDDAHKVCSILDESNLHYRAVASDAKVRLYFLNRDISGCYYGTALCGITVRITGSSGYPEPLKEPVTVLHADDGYSILPLWLCPMANCKPLNSSVTLVGETEWIDYMKQVYNWLRENGVEAYATTIETAKILNKHFRKHPFNEQRMTDFLDIMDFELNIRNYYVEETDHKGKTKTVFQKDEFAEWLIRRYHLINLDYIAHKYSSGVYIPATEADCNGLLHKYLKNSNSAIKREMVQTIFTLLGINAHETALESDMYYDLKSRCKPEMIAFNNGIYDISTGGWSDFSPDIIITNRIPVDYVDFSSQISSGVKTDAMETIDNWLDSFSEGNRKKRAVLEEVAGLALYHRNMGLRRQHTILVGETGSGKSTFIEMAENLIGKENCSHIALEDICSPNDRFCTYSLVGKILNSYGDISPKLVKDSNRLKNLCTSDAIKVEQKNQPATTLKWDGKMLFGCNSLLGIYDRALFGRFEIIPCNARYDSADRPCDHDLYKNSLSKPDCIRYWCYLAVQGLKRFIGNNYNHTCCEEIELFRAKYINKADSVAAFLGSVQDDEINNHETGEVFSRYISYCANVLKLPDCEISHLSKNSFTSGLKRNGYETKRKSVNNDKIQVYIKRS